MGQTPCHGPQPWCPSSSSLERPFRTSTFQGKKLCNTALGSQARAPSCLQLLSWPPLGEDPGQGSPAFPPSRETLGPRSPEPLMGSLPLKYLLEPLSPNVAAHGALGSLSPRCSTTPCWKVGHPLSADGRVGRDLTLCQQLPMGCHVRQKSQAQRVRELVPGHGHRRPSWNVNGRLQTRALFGWASWDRSPKQRGSGSIGLCNNAFLNIYF